MWTPRSGAPRSSIRPNRLAFFLENARKRDRIRPHRAAHPLRGVGSPRAKPHPHPHRRRDRTHGRPSCRPSPAEAPHLHQPPPRTPLHHHHPRRHHHRLRNHLHRHPPPSCHRRRLPPARPGRLLDRQHRQPEPRDVRREYRECEPRSQLAPRAPCLTTLSSLSSRPQAPEPCPTACSTSATRRPPSPPTHSSTPSLSRASSPATARTPQGRHRNAQAISKVALACLALVEDNRITDIRIAAASLREVPTRCPDAEAALLNQPITPETWPGTIAAARAALIAEARPIDDIRSTARYRASIAANLLEEFLRTLSP